MKIKSKFKSTLDALRQHIAKLLARHAMACNPSHAAVSCTSKAVLATPSICRVS